MSSDDYLNERRASPQRVTITVDGRTVEGVFLYRERYAFEIEIQPPLIRLRTGLYIMCLARSAAHHFLGEYGDEAARSLLEKLYRLSVFLEERKAALLQALATVHEEVGGIADPEVLDDETYRAERLKLRHQLRQGQIELREQQRRMREIGKRHEKYDRQRHALFEAFFDTHIPLAYSVDLRKQVLALSVSWQQEEG